MLRLPRLSTYVDDEGGVRGFVSHFEDDLDALFVDPTHQGKGVGKRLLDHVKAREPILALGVFAKNERGVKFCRREGFEIIGSRIDEASKETILGMKWKRK